MNHTTTPTTLHPRVEQLLRQRGHHEHEIEEILSWDLKKLPDLTQMHDLERSALRIIQEITLSPTPSIGIYGDYDVDGTTASALFSHFFRHFHISVQVFQPDRFKEGYGLHKSSIDKAISAKVTLLITVDCGITNFEAASYAQSKGLDLIITDHHGDILPELPPAYAIVNPNRRDEPAQSPLKKLSGVGVAFAVCLKIKQLWDQQNPASQLPSLYSLLPWVAIGTLCDLVPLSPMNLKLARHGMKALRQHPYPGLKIFFTDDDAFQNNRIDYEKVTFQIGPMINAKGRLEHPEQSYQLLMSDSHLTAKDHFHALYQTNQERKRVQQLVTDEAQKVILSDPQHQQKPLHFVYAPHWHEGVVGIVASRLVENFKKPVIVLTNSSERGIIKGSARSYGSLNLFEILKEAEEFFIKFGGHKAAAGMSLLYENLPHLKAKLYKIFQEKNLIPKESTTEHYEMKLPLSELTVELLRSLECLEPFGPENKRPTILLSPIQVQSFQIMKDLHVRWHLIDPYSPRIQLKGITFNYLKRPHFVPPEEVLKRQQKEELKIYGTLKSNYWQGNEFLQFQVDQLILN